MTLRILVAGSETPVGSALASRLEREGVEVHRLAWGDVGKLEAPFAITPLLAEDALLNAAVLVQPDLVDEPLLRLGSDSASVAAQALAKVMSVASLALRHIVMGKEGQLLLIAPLAGSGPGTVLSSSVAGALGALCRVTASEMGRFGVRSNMIEVAAIETEERRDWPVRRVEQLRMRLPLQRFGTPDDVVSAAVQLLQQSGGFMTGATIRLDGGFSVA